MNIHNTNDDYYNKTDANTNTYHNNANANTSYNNTIVNTHP